MTDGIPLPLGRRFAERVRRLEVLEQRVAAAPSDVPLRLERAALLEEMGLSDGARDAYVEILGLHAFQYDAMMRLGTLLARSGQNIPARTIFSEAVVRHPERAEPVAYLANLLLDDNDLAGACSAFEAALRIDPASVEAHRGLAIAYERRGEVAAAAVAWRRGFPDGSIAIGRYRGRGEPVRVLIVVSAIGGNVPLQWVLDERVFQVATLVAESYSPEITLPPHDVAINAIGDADRSHRALAIAAGFVDRLVQPVLNPPERVLQTGRVANAQRLRGIAGVRTARVASFARDRWLDAGAVAMLHAAGFTFPLLVRSPGYHTGNHFELVAAPGDLAAAVAALPGEELLAIEYLDTRLPDGSFRKYRVMYIGGEPFPIHAAVSRAWKVHYFSADMAESSAAREIDAAFLSDVHGTIGAPALEALGRVAAVLGLDYGGIDFALDASGNVVVYEANATMVILPPTADDKWDYRRGPIRRALYAARALLRRATSGAPPPSAG